VTPDGAERLEVRVPNVAAAMRTLNNFDYVRDATIFADVLHVLTEQGSTRRLIADLDGGGFPGAEAKPIPATLEDVFVTLTRQRAYERAQENANV
jgi:hypothetical protein